MRFSCKTPTGNNALRPHFLFPLQEVFLCSFTPAFLSNSYPYSYSYILQSYKSKKASVGKSYTPIKQGFVLALHTPRGVGAVVGQALLARRQESGCGWWLSSSTPAMETMEGRRRWRPGCRAPRRRRRRGLAAVEAAEQALELRVLGWGRRGLRVWVMVAGAG
jgi:hypothetical protein